MRSWRWNEPIRQIGLLTAVGLRPHFQSFPEPCDHANGDNDDGLGESENEGGVANEAPR